MNQFPRWGVIGGDNGKDRLDGNLVICWKTFPCLFPIFLKAKSSQPSDKFRETHVTAALMILHFRKYRGK